MDSFSKCVFVKAGKHTSVHDVHPHSYYIGNRFVVVHGKIPTTLHSTAQIYYNHVDIRHWPMQIYYMNVMIISTINNYLQNG